MQLNLTTLGEGRCLPAYIGRPAPSHAAVVCFPDDERALAGGRARVWRRRTLDRRRLAARLARATDRLWTGPRGPRRRRPQLGSPRRPLAPALVIPAKARIQGQAPSPFPVLPPLRKGREQVPSPGACSGGGLGRGPKHYLIRAATFIRGRDRGIGQSLSATSARRASPRADRSPRRRAPPAPPPSDARRPGRWPPARRRA